MVLLLIIIKELYLKKELHSQFLFLQKKDFSKAAFKMRLKDLCLLYSYSTLCVTLCLDIVGYKKDL